MCVKCIRETYLNLKKISGYRAVSGALLLRDVDHHRVGRRRRRPGANPIKLV